MKKNRFEGRKKSIKMNFRFSSILFGSVIFCALFVQKSSAQYKPAGSNSERTDHPYITWVSQYPVKKDSAAKENVFKRVFEFLIGKDKANSMVRPVEVLAMNPSDFWVLDQGSKTIFKVQKNKEDIPKPIRKKEGYFTSLVGACLLPGNELLFTDSRLNKVFALREDQKNIGAFNDTIVFQQPTGIAYSAAKDEVWVVETGAHRVSILNTRGELIKRIGSRGDENGQFNFPTSIWIDKGGDAYVVDAMNFRVQIFNKDGAFVSTFGTAGDASGFFARPKGIATDTYGNIYVADALFHVVQIFDRAGNFLYSFGKQGREKEEFWMPSGIYIDSKNYIYVADSYNSRVQVFQLINGG